jgi:hypothetical protein
VQEPVAAAAADRGPLRVVALELVALSALVLFVELALIRWLPGKVRVLAYFPNLVLISAFLGLGIGCLRADRRPLAWLWPAAMVVLCAVAVALGRVAFTDEGTSDHFWLLYLDLPPDAPVIGDVRLPIVLTFVLNAACFVPLGQMVAERLQVFRERSSSLWGYSFDIGGSIVGVIAFAAVAFSGAFPIVWFAAFLAVGAWFFRRPGRLLAGYLAAAAAMLALVGASERAERYSPYYAVSRSDTPPVRILVNGSYHQCPLPLRRADPSRGADHDLVRAGYHAPYDVIDRPPMHVLVLGAGSGNDVSVALDRGAERVDAVEIDPVILELGREIHPDRPYDSPRVRAFNTDARSFLNDTGELYDLIVFGTLDSMTRLSALSNVRLDNFVYTVECLRAARARLKPDGGIAMYFMVGHDYIAARLDGMLTEAFGRRPLVLDKDHRLFNRVYLAGSAFASLFAAQPEPPPPPAIELPHDDWPYLYLRSRGIGGFYLSLMAAFAALAAAGIWLASDRKLFGGGARFDAEMFLFGLAFLLLETKSVTEMNLLWAATWLTSAVVFGSILTMILLATVLTGFRPIRWRTAVVGLAASLVCGYLVPTEAFLGMDPLAKLGASLFFVGLPIFFASICFALLFAARANAGIAFGWNLLGAVAGGLLEFASMAIGFKGLSLVALAAYLLAAGLRGRRG